MNRRNTPTEPNSPYFSDRPFCDWRQEFDDRGFVIFRNVLSAVELSAIRAALEPYLAHGKVGRNDFEGLFTNRVYALLAKGSVFADLAIHPLALAFAEADLGPSLLLSSCLAINLHPGETVQPWHFDDSPIRIPRPRPPCGVSTFWAIDETTELNGATEVIPGSHLWGEASVSGNRADAVKLSMPAGSVAIAKGALWHRGGANQSDATRLIITPQYCPGWARPLETMLLAVPPSIASGLPERARELLGYSIHPPFIGYVDGVHPRRTLDAHEHDWGRA
jgi:hypothetical protein